jgi:hypothetical protein
MSHRFKPHDSSEEEYFTALSNTLEELGQRVAGLDQRQLALADQLDHALKAVACSASARSSVAGWSYDSRDVNLYFNDVYAPDPADNPRGRWVGTSGVLTTRLGLPRTMQYDFLVRGVEFALPEYQDGFHLRVDNRRYAWLTTGEGWYQTLILENRDAAELTFELIVEIKPEAKNDVTFSFSAIEIRKHE